MHWAYHVSKKSWLLKSGTYQEDDSLVSSQQEVFEMHIDY
jgi:hypothetical protein